MADWMTVRVKLVSGRGTDFDPPPGRVFLVGPGHNFGELALQDVLRTAGPLLPSHAPDGDGSRIQMSLGEAATTRCLPGRGLSGGRLRHESELGQ